mgnify:CR=1 FL=1
MGRSPDSESDCGRLPVHSTVAFDSSCRQTCDSLPLRGQRRGCTDFPFHPIRAADQAPNASTKNWSGTLGLSVGGVKPLVRLGKGAQTMTDRGFDARRIQTALGQHLRGLGVFHKEIGQTQVEHRRTDTFSQ